MSSDASGCWIEVAAALLGGVAVTAIAGIVAGPSLGMVLGGLFAAVILLPPLAAVRRSLRQRAAISAAMIGGIAIAWLALIGPGRATFFQWSLLVLLLASFAAALASLTVAVESLTASSTLAAAAGVVVGVAWLTWPIWLSPALAKGGSPRLIHILVETHPGLVANGLLTFTTPWTEQAVAYRLTVLDQDVAIQLPGNPLAAILANCLAAGACIAVTNLNITRYGSTGPTVSQ